MNANFDRRKCRSFSSNPNKTHWTEICPMMVSEQIKLNSLYEEREQLKIKPDHFLSMYDTHSSAIRHCWSALLEKLLKVWGKPSAWITYWFFSSGSSSLILYKEVAFQKHICVANLTTSSQAGITALSSAHPPILLWHCWDKLSDSKLLGPQLADKLLFSERERNVISWERFLQYQKSAILSYVSRSKESDKAISKCMTGQAQDIFTAFVQSANLCSEVSNSNHSFMTGHNVVIQIYPQSN